MGFRVEIAGSLGQRQELSSQQAAEEGSSHHQAWLAPAPHSP